MRGALSKTSFSEEDALTFEAKTTGPEILKDFEGKRLDYWVPRLHFDTKNDGEWAVRSLDMALAAPSKAPARS